MSNTPVSIVLPKQVSSKSHYIARGPGDCKAKEFNCIPTGNCWSCLLVPTGSLAVRTDAGRQMIRAENAPAGVAYDLPVSVSEVNEEYNFNTGIQLRRGA